MSELTPEQEALTDRLEDALVAYDEDGRLFGTSGAGAYFLAKSLAPVVAQMLADERERIAREIEALPTTRTKAWDKGWDSVSLADALHIARGGDDQ